MTSGQETHGQSQLLPEPRPQPEPPVDVEIHVNEKPVQMVGHHHTGLEIKKAAIAQHVKIEIDFLLYLVRPHQPNQPIGDNESITITRESHFHAIADDDNS